MADSMFNTNGSLSSTDPKVIQAAMRATGGQILPSSPSFKRALELAQLRDVQMQQGMAQGAQAVKNLQQYQAANPPTISGLPSNQVVTSDTGYKAVLDAQGNIVGTNVPTAPVSDTVGKFADERAAFNQGKGTMLERAALGPNIRDAFLKEYAKPKPVAEMPPMPAQTPIGPAASRLINQDYLGNAFAAAAPPPTSAGAGNSAQKSRLEQDIGLMEAQFGAQGAAPNRGQNPQGANRAELYRELQKLTEEIKSGVTFVPGEFSSDYGFSGASEIPLSPQQLTDKAQRVAEVQSAIKGSQEVVQPTDEAAIAKWLGMTKQLEGMQRPAMPPMAAGAGVRAPAVSPVAAPAPVPARDKAPKLPKGISLDTRHEAAPEGVDPFASYALPVRGRSGYMRSPYSDGIQEPFSTEGIPPGTYLIDSKSGATFVVPYPSFYSDGNQAP